MQHLGDFRIDQYVTFGVQLHRFSSGAVYAPTGSVTYTFYENNSTSGAPTGGNLAQLNSKTGLYSARVQLTTAAGFEAGKDYFVHVEATVDSVAAGELFMFRVVDVPTVDVTSLGGSTQSATDLKDFADTGYDPSAHKVQGVVLTDTVTTYTGNTPQTGDAYGRIGSNGAGLTALGDTRIANLDAAVSSRSTYAGADTAGTTTLLTRLTSARAGYLDNLSAGAVALETSLQTLITTIGASAAGVASAVWSAGTRVLTAATNLTTDLATPTNITAGTITNVTNLTNAPTSGDLTATMKASVNAEVLDVLNVDTFAEPGQGTPGATISLAAKIGYLYKFLRNKKTQTATTKSIYNDDASTVDHKCTVADDGTTYSETEMTTGP